jgi:hypothetical protein
MTKLLQLLWDYGCNLPILSLRCGLQLFYTNPAAVTGFDREKDAGQDFP